MSRLEQEVLALEREYWQIPDIQAVQKRLVALEQQLAKLWMYQGTTPPAPNSTASGQVLRCNGTSFPSPLATVSIADAGTGVVLATGTCDGSGLFSISLFLASNTAVTITGTDAGTYAARLVPVAISTTLTAGGTTAVGGIQLTPSTGFHCISGCGVPLPDTLNFSDSLYGAFTMTYNSGTGFWDTGTNTVNFPGSTGSCSAAAPGMGIIWRLTTATNVTMSFNAISISNQCPKTGALGADFTSGGSYASTTPACGPFSMTASNFENIYPFTGGLHVGGSGTVTITE